MKDARIRLVRRSPLQKDLDARVNAWFEANGKSQRGGARLGLKAATIFAWFWISWGVALSGAGGWAGLVVAALSMGFALAGLGFNVMHDGCHSSFSESREVNRWMGAVLDFLGGSSYVWKVKHNVMHHTYPNIVGSDDDVEVGGLARLAPEQPRRRFHGLQQFYMWVLYGFISMKWHWWDDFVQVGQGRIGEHAFPRPKGQELWQFIVGRLVFVAWAMVVPVLVIGFWPALVLYVVSQFSLGVTLAVVFQLAHCVEEAEFPAVAGVTEPVEMDYAELQLATTVDFARGNPLVTWYLGGLNYQVIHHLFPRVSHVHYAYIAPIVAEVCAEHGVKYRTQPTMWGALKSHARWLRRMGAPVTEPAQVASAA